MAAFAPNIRFEGFTEPWEKRKLGELLEFRNGFNGESGRYGTGTPLISVMDILNNNFITADSIRSKAKLTEAEIQRYKVEYGDVLFQRSSENFEDAGTSNVYFDKNKAVIFGGFVICGKRKLNYDPYFMKYELTTQNIRKQIQTKAQGAQHINVSQESLQLIEISLPLQEEQQAIGSYFRNLDNLIAQHQSKANSLKEVKKVMLSKMFPKEGKDVPEIRFEGFTEPWEKRKLGDIFKEYSEKNHTELPALTIVQGGGTVKRDDSDRNLMYDKTNLSNYKMVRKDDFIVHLRSFEGGLERSLLNGIISPAYHTFHSDEADSRFYYPYFRSYDFINRKLIQHVYGIRDGRSIDIEGMKNIEIPYTSLEEQQKIGEYLDHLDNLITQHQSKADSLKEFKKYMLSNMFPKD